MKVHPLGPAHFGYAYSSNWVPWLKAHVSEYDLVVINGLWQFTGFGAWRALRNSDTPYVVFPHGMLDPWFKHTYPLKHVKKWLYWPWAEYRVLRDAKAVIFTTEEECALARQSFWLYRVNAAVVNYGTADPGPIPFAAKAAFYAAFPLLHGKNFLLFLGRIHPKKGCDLLIEAFANVYGANGEDTHLVIAGPDATNWRPELAELAERLGIGERIVWSGELQNELKWGAFAAAEAFVLVSHQENFGIAVAEALACELPVLITDKINIWREIVDGNAGFVGSDTVEGAKQLLSKWRSTSNERRNQMRRSARATFLKHFEIGGMVRSFAEIVSPLVHRNS
jgi:glycosyltransferase involved in cell wall biosynthesis